MSGEHESVEPAESGRGPADPDPGHDPWAVRAPRPEQPARSRVSTVLLVVCACLAALTGLFVVAGFLLVFMSTRAWGNK